MEKKNKGLIIVIVILLLGLLCSIGYICYDKGVFGGNKENSNNKIETKAEDKNSKSEKIALDDSRFYGIYNKLKAYAYTRNRSDGWQSFSDTDLLNIVAIELTEEDFTKTDEITDTGWGDYYYTLSNSTIIKYLSKYFGNSVKIEGFKLVNQTFGYATKMNFDNKGGGMVIVSYSNDQYKVRFSGIGGGVVGPHPRMAERKIVSAVLENNQITVKEKVIYYDTESKGFGTNPITYNIYSDVEKKNKIDTKEYTEDNINDGVITIEDYLDKASTITYKFAYDKDTDRYYFKSSVIE